MEETPTDKLEAILEELETERERRQRAKVESGEIVRIELTVAVGEADELESAVAKAKADKLAELQAAGETREIHFDVFAVVTGVPRYENEFPPTSPPALESHTNKWERYDSFSEPPTLRLGRAGSERGDQSRPLGAGLHLDDHCPGERYRPGPDRGRPLHPRKWDCDGARCVRETDFNSNSETGAGPRRCGTAIVARSKQACGLLPPAGLPGTGDCVT
jgi:hypothetical protein